MKCGICTFCREALELAEEGGSEGQRKTRYEKRRGRKAEVGMGWDGTGEMGRSRGRRGCGGSLWELIIEKCGFGGFCFARAAAVCSVVRWAVGHSIFFFSVDCQRAGPVSRRHFFKGG